MILSGHQPCSVPWLGWYNKLLKADLFVILDDIQPSRGDFINRSLFNFKGRDKYLTMPLEWHGHLEKTIRQMEFAIDKPHWREDGLHKLLANYPKNLWIDAWYDSMLGSHNLVSACDFSLELARALDITTPVEYQSRLGITGHKSGLIVNLCRHFGATEFLFGSEGFQNYGREVESYGIRAIRQEYTPPDWPPLSILHYLIMRGHEETKTLINNQAGYG